MSVTYIRHMKDLSEGIAGLQRQILAEEENARIFKNFAHAVIPGKFQTRDYATSVFRQVVPLLGADGDVEEMVNARMERGALVRDEDFSFHAVIAEQALRGSVTTREVMREQLEYLLELAELDNVQLGILPMDAKVSSAPITHIDIVDNRMVSVESLVGTAVFIGEPEVDVYLRVFRDYAEAAYYGNRAEDLIREVSALL